MKRLFTGDSDFEAGINIEESLLTKSKEKEVIWTTPASKHNYGASKTEERFITGGDLTQNLHGMPDGTSITVLSYNPTPYMQRAPQETPAHALEGLVEHAAMGMVKSGLKLKAPRSIEKMMEQIRLKHREPMPQDYIAASTDAKGKQWLHYNASTHKFNTATGGFQALSHLVGSLEHAHVGYKLENTFTHHDVSPAVLSEKHHGETLLKRLCLSVQVEDADSFITQMRMAEAHLARQLKEVRSR